MDQIRQNLRSDKSWFDWWYVFKNIIARLAKKYTKHYFTGTDTIPHDRGIIRAINSTYQPNERVEGDPRYTIFVGKLHIKTDEVNSFPTFCSYSDQFWQPTKTDVIRIHQKNAIIINYFAFQDTLKYKFRKFGRIVGCRVVRDIITGVSKCYAFIEFESSSSAREAVKTMNRRQVDNSEILVDYECER